MSQSMREALRPFVFTNKIFLDNDEAIEFLLNYEILPRVLKCPRCSRFMNIQRYNRSLNGRCYRCNNCTTAYNIKQGNKILDRFNIKFCMFLRLAFIWIYNLPNFAISGFAEVSEPTYIRFKESMLDVIESTEVIIEPIVEITICNDQIITDSSNTVNNKVNGIERITGEIDQEESSKFLKEFKWKKRMLKYNDPESLLNGFVTLMKCLRNFCEK